MAAIQDIPAIRATQSNPACTSDRFSFVSTEKVIDILDSAGWKAVRAFGSTKDPYARHRVHFRRHSDENNTKLFKGESVPEAVLFNGHNGTTKYKLAGGIFRAVCSNGMIICEDNYGEIKTRHLQVTEGEILERSYQIVENFSKLAEVVNEWKEKEVENPLNFAVAASYLRWKDGGLDDADRTVFGSYLLNQRRPEDSGNRLWSVFNRVQENLTQGGFINPLSGRKVQPVNEVYKNTRINEELWALGQHYAMN